MYFQLFTNCFFVNGINTDALYDLHFSRIINLPKRISKLLQGDLKKYTIEEVKAKYPDWVEGLEAYMGYLIENDFAFKTKEPHKFPPIDLTYHSPFYLDNAIVHISKEIDASNAIQQIIDLGAQGFQLIFDDPGINEIQKYTDLFIGSRVRRVEFLLRESGLSLSQLQSLNDDSRCVYRSFNASDAQKQDLLDLPEDDPLHAHYSFNVDELNIFKKESYEFDLFALSLQHFAEAQTRNVGLNKKVCIDIEGNIKNYISHNATFGNIKKDSISEVVSTEEFQKVWFIDNSQIEKCKDCIYRMVCYSCSDIIVKGGKLYKKDDCNYDPITDQWAE